MSTGGAAKPWYREPWPWLLMLPPAASVVAGLTLAYLAVHDASPLVVDDYANIEAIAREESDAGSPCRRARPRCDADVAQLTDAAT